MTEYEIKRLEDRIRELWNEKEDLLKENEQLKQQIEKMKCCQNCKSEDNDYMEKPCCDCIRCLGDIKRNGTSDKWELEND